MGRASQLDDEVFTGGLEQLFMDLFFPNLTEICVAAQPLGIHHVSAQPFPHHTRYEMLIVEQRGGNEVAHPR